MSDPRASEFGPDLVASDWQPPDDAIQWQGTPSVEVEGRLTPFKAKYIGVPHLGAPLPSGYGRDKPVTRRPYFLDYGGRLFELRYVRVFRDDTPAYVELWSHPVHGNRIITRGLERVV